MSNQKKLSYLMRIIKEDPRNFSKIEDAIVKSYPCLIVQFFKNLYKCSYPTYNSSDRIARLIPEWIKEVRSIALYAVKINGIYLEHFKKFNEDYEVVMYAITNVVPGSEVLDYVSEKLFKSDVLVELAIKNGCYVQALYRSMGNLNKLSTRLRAMAITMCLSNIPYVA